MRFDQQDGCYGRFLQLYIDRIDIDICKSEELKLQSRPRSKIGFNNSLLISFLEYCLLNFYFLLHYNRQKMIFIHTSGKIIPYADR